MIIVLKAVYFVLFLMLLLILKAYKDILIQWEIPCNVIDYLSLQ